MIKKIWQSISILATLVVVAGVLFAVVGMICDCNMPQHEVLVSETQLVAVTDSYVVLTSGSIFGFDSEYAAFVTYAVSTDQGIRVRSEPITKKVFFVEDDNVSPVRREYAKQHNEFLFGALHTGATTKIEFIIPEGGMLHSFNIDLE